MKVSIARLPGPVIVNKILAQTADGIKPPQLFEPDRTFRLRGASCPRGLCYTSPCQPKQKQALLASNLPGIGWPDSSKRGSECGRASPTLPPTPHFDRSVDASENARRNQPIRVALKNNTTYHTADGFKISNMFG